MFAFFYAQGVPKKKVAKNLKKEYNELVKQP